MGVFILSMRQRKDTLMPHYGFISQNYFLALFTYSKSGIF